MRWRCDVVIFGGGPAGSATALALAQSQRSVLVLESSNYDRVRIGETLPPIARVPLTRLGVWDRFLAQGHTPSPGNVSAWGRPEPYEEQFIFNAYGAGWHLDRTRFDAMLASAAEQMGTAVLRGARVKSCASTSTGEWEVGFLCRGATHTVRSPLLVDATGRASSLARRSGARRCTYDRLVGIAGLFPAEIREVCDTRTLVEACELGWWYSAGLPNGRLIVAFMTDADLLPVGLARVREHWRRQLEPAPYTRARVAGRLAEGPLRIMSARSGKLDRMAGHRWLAVGDAALTMDPLSSRGITTALQYGLSAAGAIERWSNGQQDALVEWQRDAENDFEHYLTARAVHYRREHRWPASQFWRRRCEPPTVEQRS